MPELPEVETVRRELLPVLRGRLIRSVELRLPKLLKTPRPQFVRALAGARVTAIDRRAKLFLMSLSSGWTIVIHLKMSGQLIWQPQRGRLRGGGHPIPGSLGRLPNKYSHVIFHFDRGTLYFNDSRQFGFVRLVRTVGLAEWIEQQGIGPEIVGGKLTPEQFHQRLRIRRSSRLKALLMDQGFVAGLGNIYADESLFAAKLKPTRRVASLTRSDIQRFYRSIRQVLNLGVRKGGTTMQFFVRSNGKNGGMLPFLKVYGRADQPCRRCKTPIKKIRLNQRGTHFCPNCQR